MFLNNPLNDGLGSDLNQKKRIRTKYIETEQILWFQTQTKYYCFFF